MALFVFQASLGRLGNQIFHLAALDKLCASPRDVGVLFGGRGLRENFSWRRRNVIVVTRGAGRLCAAIRGLATRGFASLHTENKRGETPYPVEDGTLSILTQGRLPIHFIENAYLQSEAWITDRFRERLEFRPQTKQAVDVFRTKQNLDWDSTIFVHVRRTDYMQVNVEGAGPAILPSSYYREGIRRLEQQMKVSQILFVTDDPDYVGREFVDIGRHLIVSQTPAFDLCLMSRCASGVISASSFSWWGAMLGPRRIKPVAPQHWLGWRLGKTIPSAILSRSFDALQVSPESSP